MGSLDVARAYASLARVEELKEAMVVSSSEWETEYTTVASNT
jgi:hypothetical protein